MTYLDTLNSVAGELGVALWLLIIIAVWTLFWKITALWKSARNNQFVWFIVFMFVNTIGILEILYIYVFSKMKKEKKPVKKKVSKKKVIKKK